MEPFASADDKLKGHMECDQQTPFNEAEADEVVKNVARPDRRVSRRWVKLLLRDYLSKRKSSDTGSTVGGSSFGAESPEERRTTGTTKETEEAFGFLNATLADLNSAKELDKMRTEYKNR